MGGELGVPRGCCCAGGCVGWCGLQLPHGGDASLDSAVSGFHGAAEFWEALLKVVIVEAPLQPRAIIRFALFCCLLWCVACFRRGGCTTWFSRFTSRSVCFLCSFEDCLSHWLLLSLDLCLQSLGAFTMWGLVMD